MDSNEQLTQAAAVKRRRRRSVGWKSGLMLTGLGAVVLGAGYLAGVNAPAVAQTSAAQTVMNAGSASVNAGQSALVAPDSGATLDDQQAFGLDENATTQLSPQFSGRRGRQARGFSQQQPDLSQQPNFSAPLTRSRGS